MFYYARPAFGFASRANSAGAFAGSHCESGLTLGSTPGIVIWMHDQQATR